MRIVLDPGHGGRDPGAVANGLQEKFLTWEIANGVKKRLDKMKCEVVVIQPSTFKNSTKEDELFLPPQEAVRLKADYYLSIHINAGGGTGFESFVHPDDEGKEADKLRNVLHRQLAQYFGRYGLPDRGRKYANFAVLRITGKAGIPSCLIECGFIDNQKDASLLKSPVFIDKLANEITYGLIIALGLQRG